MVLAIIAAFLALMMFIWSLTVIIQKTGGDPDPYDEPTVRIALVQSQHYCSALETFVDALYKCMLLAYLLLLLRVAEITASEP